MRISSATTTPIDIRLSASLKTGAGSIGDRGGLRVTVTADGFVGVGETAAIPGQPGPGLERLATETTAWCEAAEGGPIDEVMDDLGRSDLSPISRFAVHTAMLDILSRRDDLSASQWLQPGAATRIQVNGLISDASPAAVHQRATELMSQNTSAIKLKVGVQDAVQDTTRIIAASEAAGNAVELRLDANGAWDAETAIRILGRVGKHRISYVEDPTPHRAEFSRIAAETGVDVAVDLAVEPDADEAIEQAQVSTIVVKPAAIGGVDRLLALTERHYKHRFIVSSSIQREVGLAAAVHAAAALRPNESWQVHGSGPHGLATGRLVHNMDETLFDASGQVRVPAGPGIWNEVSPSDAPDAKYA